MTTEKLTQLLTDVRDDPEVIDDYHTADRDLQTMMNDLGDYDNHHGTQYQTSLWNMMDDHGIVDREVALQDAKTDKKELEEEDETADPQYSADVGNIDYLEDNDDMCFAGPLWHSESYGTFTGDRGNYDAIHGEDVSDMAGQLLDEIKQEDC